MKWLAFALITCGLALANRFAGRGLDCLPLAVVGVAAAAGGVLWLVILWFAGL